MSRFVVVVGQLTSRLVVRDSCWPRRTISSAHRFLEYYTTMNEQEFLAEVNKYDASKVAAFFKVSSETVENWKNGVNVPGPDWYRDTLVRIMNEKGVQ